MDDPSQILDAGATTADFHPKDNLASRGKRFISILIDTAGYYVMAIAAFVLLVLLTGNPALFDSKPAELSLSLSIYFLYFFIFESVFGKTPGKLIMRTHVIDVNGNKPTIARIAGRTLSRMVPFDAFSFFGDPPLGWHDAWSGTFVVNDRKKGSY